MGQNSKIEWTDHTFNTHWGCTKVSPGCKNCYAETMSNRFGAWWGPGAPRRNFGFAHWNEPVKWNRKAAGLDHPQFVFCNSMSDLMEDRSDLSKNRAMLFSLVERTPHLVWLLLTKRPENFRRFIPPLWANTQANVFLGASAENQEWFDKRIPEILFMKRRYGFKTFLSLEPLLGPINIELYFMGGHPDRSWVIVGGESGPGARPMEVDWARSIKDQCQAAGIPFFMKQLGGVHDKRGALDDLPEDLRIRERPIT